MIAYRVIYRYMYILWLLFTHVFLLCQVNGSISNNPPRKMSILIVQILVSNISKKKKKRTRNPWVNGDSKIGTQHTLYDSGASWVPESKKFLKGNTQWWGLTKWHRSPWKSSQCPKLEEFEQQNKTILDNKAKYKVNIHEFRNFYK